MDKKIYEEVRQEFAITSANEYFGIIKRYGSDRDV